MLRAEFTPYRLIFKKPSGTSRGVLTTKETWFVKIWHDKTPAIYGLGECAIFRGLGCDDRPDYESVIQSLSSELPCMEVLRERLKDFPSILFGIETAMSDLENQGKRIIFPSPFSEGKDSIRINGLIWMGTKEEMRTQIIDKLDKGFTCIKLKIGAIDFDAEVDLLKAIRKEFTSDRIELRVDANGAFSPKDALTKLEILSKLNIHSIEQPIKANQWEEMSRLCEQTPLPIALDEELIGVNEFSRKKALLDTVRPQYIILKPSLHGGFVGSKEWIDLAQERSIQWWITSALESNIGLNAISQWCYKLNNPLPQGLGTGLLYTNNFPSPLTLKGERLFYNPEINWDLSLLEN